MACAANVGKKTQQWHRCGRTPVRAKNNTSMKFFFSFQHFNNFCDALLSRFFFLRGLQTKNN
jgi:hypothetical protein